MGVAMAQNCQIFTDQNGAQIEFRVTAAGEQGLRIEAVHSQHGRVGCAAITKLGATGWRLEDIRIDDEVPVRAWYQFHIGRINFGGQPNTVSYRNRGIGTALMDFLKQAARQQGVKEIEGAVSHQDIESASHLLAWYGKQGFRIILRASVGAKAAETKLVWRPNG